MENTDDPSLFASYKGHNSTVTAVSFNPNMFSTTFLLMLISLGSSWFQVH